MSDEQALVYLKGIIVPLLAKPVLLSLVHTSDDRGLFIKIAVCKEDMGRIIGKGGEAAKAIRRLVRQYGLTVGVKVSLRFDEPEK